MRAEKRRGLEAKGWKVGSAKDFLGLTDQEAAYIELRVKLAQGLKAKRNSRGLSQTELAKVVRSSRSRVAKMEAGDPTVSLDLLVRSLLALGASNGGGRCRSSAAPDRPSIAAVERPRAAKCRATRAQNEMERSRCARKCMAARSNCLLGVMAQSISHPIQ